MFGHLIPDHWDPKIAVHFAHRVGALVVTLAILATTAHVWYHQRSRRELTRPATLVVGLVAVQITLGALTVLSRRDVGSTACTSCAARCVLTTSLVSRCGAGASASRRHRRCPASRTVDGRQPDLQRDPSSHASPTGARA